MGTVLFRDFEPRDLEFVHKCKNDEKLNSLVVGHWAPFTIQQSQTWLDGCIRADNPSYKFWAVCTNDDEKRIVGWISLSNIDPDNKSACSHGIVIGDKNYQDGMAWIECGLFLYSYVFDTLGYNRIYGSYREDHLASRCIALAMFETVEGTARQAVYKNGTYTNVIYSSILREEYMSHKLQGDYELGKIIRRMIKAKKELLNR